jgi:hypothetical protein
LVYNNAGSAAGCTVGSGLTLSSGTLSLTTNATETAAAAVAAHVALADPHPVYTTAAEAAAAAPVQSVVGRTGAVSLAVADVSGLGTAATAATTDFLPTTFSASAITYAASVALDMSALAGGYRTISLTGDLTFTTSNRANGRQVTIRLICDATQRTLTFPAGWVFVGTKPSTIAASKSAVLSLTFFGTADSDCITAYGVQA